jgi:predicted nucleotidyltransferase
MSKDKVKKIVEKYADKLKKHRIPLSGVYLFGSFAKGKAKKWSDIDVAIFSKRKETDQFIIEAGRIRREVDLRIETHFFSDKDLKTVSTPFVKEILETGVRVV